MKLFDAQTRARLDIHDQEAGCVRLAAQDLARDIEKVSHHVPEWGSQGTGRIVIGSLTNEAFASELPEDVYTEAIRGKWEHYIFQVCGDCLYLVGSDERGAMWAIYECSRRLLGVNPLYLWTEHVPQYQEEVVVKDMLVVDGPQDYRFRGWFINDEDLFEGFCRRGVPEKGYDYHKDYCPLIAMVVETALRLKQNLLIPCSHVDMDQPEQEGLVELVTRRGMYISMHHQEPVGVNQQRLDQWYKAQGDDTENINYVDQPDKYRKIWRHFIHKWAKYPNVIWQLGLRGRGDRPVWYQNDRVPDTAEARGALISKALQEQWDIIAEETGRRDFLSSTTLWMEGMPLYRAGALKFPQGTMVILSDFGPDQMWGEEYYETPRFPGIEYGLYYHVCFWGCGPHLVQGTRPEKILYNYRQARTYGDTTYSVLNVSNIREHVSGIACVAQATWNLDGMTEEGQFRAWCEQTYHSADGTQGIAMMKAYYDAFAHLDDRRLPGRMLLMDGMCKRVAQMLMKIIGGDELHQADIQNKRLFNFTDTDAFIAFYQQATKEGEARFAKVMTMAQELGESIPQERRAYFRSHMILQIETIRGLYGWVNGLARAAAVRRNSQNAVDFRQAITQAIRALERIKAVREETTSGIWQHWWQGDRLIGLPNILAQTRAILTDGSNPVRKVM